MTDGPLSPDAFLREFGEEIPYLPARPRAGDGAALAAFLSAPHWLERELEPPEPLLGEVVTNTTRMFIGGPTGLGKTHLGMAMAACMAAGADFLHWRASRRCRVLYVDGEMPRDLVQERTADLQRRMPGADLSGLFILCREDCEGLAERFPALGRFEPLNTPEGQAFLLRLVELLGGVDAVFFDNRMSLLAGDMKEEQPWTDTMPFVKELTRRRIAQVWLDHTGHNTGQLYGTKTKEWQFDAVALLTKAEQPGVDIAFTLEFTKARRRKPDNRADFETVTLAMAEDAWRVDGAQAAPRAKVTPMAEQFYRGFLDALCATATPGRTTRTAWYAECVRLGLAEPVNPEANYREKDAKQSRFRKYLIELRMAGLLRVDGEAVYDMRRPPPAPVSHPRTASHLPARSESFSGPEAGDEGPRK